MPPPTMATLSCLKPEGKEEGESEESMRVRVAAVSWQPFYTKLPLQIPKDSNINGLVNVLC